MQIGSSVKLACTNLACNELPVLRGSHARMFLKNSCKVCVVNKTVLHRNIFNGNTFPAQVCQRFSCPDLSKVVSDV